MTATWEAPFVEVEPRAKGIERRSQRAGGGARPEGRGSNPDLPSDVERLAIDLLNAVRGEVRFDAGSRALYATDASNYRQVPIGVVVPRDDADVVGTIEVCRAHGVPIVSRGGGTSLAGQTCNVAVVMDHSKYNNQLLELNADAGWARVRPGIVLDELRDAAERHHLTYGPDPATHDHCTLGGMIGNNSCGVHSVMAGKTDANVLELEVVTYRGARFRVGPTGDDELIRICAEAGQRGDIYRAMRAIRDEHASEIRERFPDIPRRVSGYNLPYLLSDHGFDVAKALVGSESTLMTVLEAKVRLVPSPPGRTLVVVGYPDVYAAADDVPNVIDSGCIACEGMDEKLVRDVRARGIHPDALQLLPDGHGFLLVEFGGADRRESDERARAFVAAVRRRRSDARPKLYDDPGDEAKLWKVRESGLGATAMVPGKPTSGPGWEDSAVPPEKLGDYLRAIRTLWDRYGLDADMYGHFGQGVLHCRIDFDLITPAGVAAFRRYMTDASELVVSMGGSLSGEHGDGQARGEVLPIMFGDRLIKAFEDLKDAWDPDGRMNPGKLVRPNPILSDLRLGTDYAPPKPRTWFRFPDDEGSLGHAAFRCVGVGECRRHDDGVMCPSYMVTREEKHSTRGRAHLLFELMNGGELEGGWRNEEVEEALDLCLACKGCKGECPVNVDMATLKAEFRAHHYAGRLRPRAAYTMGLIHWWAKIAARAPRLVNAAARAPVLASLGKRLGGIADERAIPSFADETFRSWWRRRGGATTGRGASRGSMTPRPPDQAPFEPQEPAGRRVILWVDTFNDHFHPDVARAAVEVLEDAGCQVVVPERTLCCGRPLYDWGFLGQAKRLLEHVLTDLRDDIRAGTPIVGLEPSCVSVFRDEAPNLLYGHADARRIAAQTQTLTEYLASTGYRPPRLDGQALVHGHCHHRSVLDFDSELDLLRATGLELESPETGCCGMAGAFGFERSGDHYAVSMAAGERVLLPAVRAAPEATYVVTGGFSCREQIEQATDRTVLHPAQLLALAIEREGEGPARERRRSARRTPGNVARQPKDPARRPGAHTGVSA
ncbi:MAG TPA: FAD-binding and (Fe-S)-binding domain-containing protein [Candidatus Limnocylindrales bacterium]|nr:FAD-binding and (Fe-S)-binding domain-containing protein [Candidatus Limnocylindrales bacterium]